MKVDKKTLQSWDDRVGILAEETKEQRIGKDGQLRRHSPEYRTDAGRVEKTLGEFALETDGSSVMV